MRWKNYIQLKEQNIILKISHSGPGIHVKGAISSGGNHPPKNNILTIADIKIILAYSPRKNKPNARDEYSTKKPATSSLSPSGRSNGARFVSANAEMKKTPEKSTVKLDIPKHTRAEILLPIGYSKIIANGKTIAPGTQLKEGKWEILFQ